MFAGYLEVDDVAAMVGVKPSTIRIYRARRTIPAPDAPLSGRLLWRPETIAEWLESRPGHAWNKGMKMGPRRRRARSVGESEPAR